MIEWLRQKLILITEEFLGGHGYGDVYEVSYLTYLECLQVAVGREPALVWTGWRARLEEHAGVGNPPQPLNREMDRHRLVAELKAFQRSLEGPRRRAFSAPPAPSVSVTSTVKEGPMDVLDFLIGEGT